MEYDDYEVEVIDAQDTNIANNTVVKDSDKDKSETSGVTVSLMIFINYKNRIYPIHRLTKFPQVSVQH